MITRQFYVKDCADAGALLVLSLQADIPLHYSSVCLYLLHHSE